MKGGNGTRSEEVRRHAVRMATEKAHKSLQIQIDHSRWDAALAEAQHIYEIIAAEWLGEPISDREEITGISTTGKNKNSGNSGFAGGCTGAGINVPAYPAICNRRGAARGG